MGEEEEEEEETKRVSFLLPTLACFLLACLSCFMPFVFRFRFRFLSLSLSQVGAAMEYFMIKTGFYEKVTQLEAEKMAEQEAKREAFLQFIETPTTQKKQ